MTATLTASKAATRKIAGLTFTRSIGTLPGSSTWECVDGVYRIVIECSRKWGLSASIRRLDPAYKAFTRDGLYHECRLNGLAPQGRTLEALMAVCVQSMHWHQAEHGREFEQAVTIPARDLKVGMKVHHKGVFYRVSKILLHDSANPKQGWTVIFSDREYPLWFTPDHSVTIAQA